nr:MAG TPA: YopX protein [Caudoviricetes sp.]
MKIENIKFKAKRLDGKGWVCGYFYEENGNTYIIENRQKESKLNRNLTYLVDPSIVCQFTGLKDSEGKEIWEGDILEGESKFEIVYTKGTFATVCIGYDERVYSYPLCYFVKEDGAVEGKVVGNKFDK